MLIGNANFYVILIKMYTEDFKMVVFFSKKLVW